MLLVLSIVSIAVVLCILDCADISNICFRTSLSFSLEAVAEYVSDGPEAVHLKEREKKISNDDILRNNLARSLRPGKVKVDRGCIVYLLHVYCFMSTIYVYVFVLVY